MSRVRVPSALEWLESIPEDWSEREVGREVWVRARLGWKGLTASEYVDDGIPMLATPDIKGARIDYTAANKITVDRYEESPEIMLHDGDVLLTKDGATIGTVNVVRDLPCPATVNGSIAVLTPSQELDGRFLYWFISSSYAQAMFDRLRGGMGVPHLFQRDIHRIRFPYPPLAEQRAIADYLDRETARIDTLIEEQQRLIEMLRERRDGVVTRAFLSTPDERRLKYTVAEVTVGIVVQPSRWYVDVGVPALRGLNVKRGSISLADVVNISEEGHAAHPKSQVRSGDVVVVRTGQAGAAAKIPDELDGINAIDILIVRPGDDMDPDFLVWYLNSPLTAARIEHGSVGALQGHFNVGALRELPVPNASIVEQRRIAAHLDERIAKIDATIAETERFIDISKERRAALITAAVTGEIDVRKVA